MSESKASFINKPNIEYMLRVMCELYERQSGGTVESTYSISPKKDMREEYSENGKS